MITKVGSISFRGNVHFKGASNEPKETAKQDSLPSAGISSEAAAAMKPASTAVTANEVAKSFITDKEVRIPNILEDLKGHSVVSLAHTDMPQKQRAFNTSGLELVTTAVRGDSRYDKKITINNLVSPKQNTLAVIHYNSKDADLPVLTYKQGKYMPEITVKHPTLTKPAKMLSGSAMVGEGFEILMPGEWRELGKPKGLHDVSKDLKTAKQKRPSGDGVSFKGKAYITTLNKEAKTRDAVDKYFDQKLYNEAVKGDYYDEVAKSKWDVVIPAGGFGERFYNLTRENENKPSYKLPTMDGYRIIATSLNMAVASGALDSVDKNDITYISQNHEIDGESVMQTAIYKTDGGAIAEGMNRFKIPSSGNIMILNADIITNADASRACHALETLPDAALVIPYYPVDGERAKSFGLLGIEQDENGNMKIKEFVEKPKYTTNSPQGHEFTATGEYDKAIESFEQVQTARNPENQDQFLANPGMYFMSREAVKVLMAKGLLEPGSTGLGADVMPKIVQMCNEGKLLSADGRPMKAYTVPLEAKGGKPAVWDDIGTAEAYLKVIKDIAHQTKINGVTPENKYYGIPEFVLNDCMANTDLETGIVYDSSEAREGFENFKKAKNVTFAQGNIYVSGK